MSTIEIETTRNSELTDLREFHLQYGWSNQLGEQIVQNSSQAHILEWTPQDHRNTFRTVKGAETWALDGSHLPIVISLGGLANELAGVAWITNASSDKPYPRRVFGVRVYDGYLGQGVGTLLAQEVHKFYDTIDYRPTHFRMLTKNSVAFVLGIGLGYKLDCGETASKVTGVMNMVRSRPDLV